MSGSQTVHATVGNLPTDRIFEWCSFHFAEMTGSTNWDCGGRRHAVVGIVGDVRVVGDVNHCL